MSLIFLFLKMCVSRSEQVREGQKDARLTEEEYANTYV